MPDIIDDCDKDPCKKAVIELGDAKGKYNAAKQDLEHLAAAFGFAAGGSVALLVAFVAEKIAVKFIPVIGWISVFVDGALLGMLLAAYIGFRIARTQLEDAKAEVRTRCPRKCWPENVLKES